MKHVLEQYSDARARVRYLRKSISDLEKKIKRMDDESCAVMDSVTCGKKGKKPLGTVKITGFPVPRYEKLCDILQKRSTRLQAEEQALLEITGQAEEYIAGLDDVEIRNILSLYYVEDLNWVQVAHRMNGMYQRRRSYTEGSCRLKHDRFLEKVLKTSVLSDA